MKVVLLILLMLFSPACNEPDFSPFFAMASIKLASGTEIYFKRQVRGINGNREVIAISTNSAPCKDYDPETDACICTGWDKIYYKIEADTLHLYYSTASSLPRKEMLPIKIQNHEIHPLDRAAFEKNYAQQGVSKVDLKTTDKQRCH